MNATTIQTTIEEADALIESIGMTEQVEDHEYNELGHVYTLQNGDTIVVTSPTGFEFHTPDEQ